MRKLLFGFLICLVSFAAFACLTIQPVKYADRSIESDSISLIGIKTIEFQNKSIAAKKVELSDTIKSLGKVDTIYIDRINEVTKIEIDTFLKVVENPKFYKIVYSVYTSRGYHCDKDTIECDLFK